jgi:hypothetical protein
MSWKDEMDELHAIRENIDRKISKLSPAKQVDYINARGLEIIKKYKLGLKIKSVSSRS